jgi:hypothetical protein
VHINPRSVICEIQPVTIDESVYEQMEHEPDLKNISKDVTLESSLTPQQDIKVRELLEKHKNIFSKNDADIGFCDKVKHRIDPIDERPFKQRHKRIPPGMVDEVRQHIEQFLACGLIRKSKSLYASNVLVRKKNGKLRLCVDYGMLNNKSVKDAYALPRI